MTSLRQLEANRRNARKSTGPRTENGKHASRRNALRHGFTAETVLEPLEDLEDYRTFEAAIVSEYLPRTPAEQELAHRLASLFWRLRRATAIETGLLRMQGEILHAFRNSRAKMVQTGEEDAYIPGFATTGSELSQDVFTPAERDYELDTRLAPATGADTARDVAISFLRLADLDNDIVDRLSRYEAALWRQLAQTLFTLNALRRR